MLVTNNFEGGTPSTTITPANSGGTSGDAFSQVDGSPTYSATRAAHGTLSAAFAANVGGSLVWDLSGNGDRYARAYLWLPSGDPDVYAELGFFAADSAMAWYAVIVVDGGQLTLTLNHYNDATTTSTVVATASVAPAAGQWIRIELSATNAASGSGEVRLYNSMDSATPTSSASGSITQPAAEWSGAYLNAYSTTGALYVDDLAVTDTGWPGPAAGSATPVSGSDAGVLGEQAAIALGAADAVVLAELAGLDAALAGLDTAALAEVAGLATDVGDAAAVDDHADAAAAVATSDSAMLDEAATVTETGGPATADTVTLTDSVALDVSVATGDSVTATDTALVSVAHAVSDAAAVAEAAELALLVADTADLAEAAALGVDLSAADAALVAETVAAGQPVTTSDTAALGEVATVTNAGRDITAVSRPWVEWAADRPYTAWAAGSPTT